MTAKEARALTDEAVAAEKAEANALLLDMIEHIKTVAKNGQRNTQIFSCKQHAEAELRRLLVKLGYVVSYTGEVSW